MDLSTFAGGRKKIEALLRIAVAKASRALAATGNYVAETNAGNIAAAVSITYQLAAAFAFKAFKVGAGGNTTATARVTASMFVLCSIVDTAVAFQLVRNPGAAGQVLIGPLVNVAAGHVTADASVTLDWIDTFVTAGANPPNTVYGIIATAAAGTVEVLTADEASITVQEIAAT